MFYDRIILFVMPATASELTTVYVDMYLHIVNCDSDNSFELNWIDEYSYIVKYNIQS
jgi:hypothetical protein